MKLGRAIKHQKRQLKAARVIGKFYLLPQEEKCVDGVLPGDKALDLQVEESLILTRRTGAECRGSKVGPTAYGPTSLQMTVYSLQNWLHR